MSGSDNLPATQRVLELLAAFGRCESVLTREAVYTVHMNPDWWKPQQKPLRERLRA
jgi:hypothetical protein